MSYVKFTIEDLERYDGQFHQYTSIGCYTVIYTANHGDLLCADCATEALRDKSEPWVYGATYDEGPTLFCDNCDKALESSYGDPDEENNESEV